MVFAENEQRAKLKFYKRNVRVFVRTDNEIIILQMQYTGHRICVYANMFGFFIFPLQKARRVLCENKRYTCKRKNRVLFHKKYPVYTRVLVISSVMNVPFKKGIRSVPYSFNIKRDLFHRPFTVLKNELVFSLFLLKRAHSF